MAHWLRWAGHGARAGALLDQAARQGHTHGLQREAEALEWPLKLPPTAPHPAPILLDIQDLLQFLHEHGSVSGIQRVQLGILAAVLEGEAGYDAVAVFPSLHDNALWAPPAEVLRAIVAYAAGHGRNLATAQRLVEQARARAVRLVPAAGAAFIILGAFWFYVGAPGFFLALRAAGVRLGVLIYDMFPVTHPECTTADTRKYFNQALGEGLPFWDFAFAISEYSAAMFRRVAAARGAPPIETVPIPLAHSFDLPRAAPPAWLDTWPAPLTDLRGREFVLAVSTIEARKNHLLLFHAWKRMIEAGERPPTLVLVGRPGWGVADLMAQLDATHWLDGRIMIAHGLSDAELEQLYRACLFTVLPSFAEGWGLAVGESLSFGKPCIAASGSALPEVGGDLVAYADSGSVPEWLACLRAWLNDRAVLAAATQRIAAEFEPRRWPAVARHLLGEAERLRQAPMRAAPAVKPLRLAADQRIAIGLTDLDQPDAVARALGQKAALGAGWYALESGLCWMRGRLAQILVGTGLPAGAFAHLSFDLVTPHWADGNALTLRIEGGEPVRVEVPRGATFTVAASGTAGADGALQVQFEMAHAPPPHALDRRGLCIGLQAITLRRSATPAPVQPAAPPRLAPLRQSVRDVWVDLSSLCAPAAESWSARRWRLGLAQAMSRVPGVGWAATRGGGLVQVPEALALDLLAAPPAARRAMLDAQRDGLESLHPRLGQRLLVLGLAADHAAARLARRDGALVTLVLAATAPLLRPHRAPEAAETLRETLFAPRSPFDAVLLGVDDPLAAAVLAAQPRPIAWAALPPPHSATLPMPPAGDAKPGPPGCVLAESWEPIMAESWALLEEPPPLHRLDADDSVALDVLLAGCRAVVSANAAGAWPGLARAAAGQGLPFMLAELGDARGNAARLQALLNAAPAPLPAGGVAWEEIALAALAFDPLRPAEMPRPTDILPVPALAEGWALAASRRP